MQRRTKIVCTLGPAVNSEEKIKELIEAGMNVARINCSHGDWKDKNQWVEWVRKHSPKIGPVAILADLQGPKFRIGDVQGGEIEAHPGQQLTLGPQGECNVIVKQKEILKTLKKNAKILLGDGDVELKVLHEDEQGRFVCSAISGGAIKSRQGVTVVGESFDCEVITEKDLEDIKEAGKASVDFIALSYVHSGEDMDKLRKHVSSHNAYIKLCAKIETRAALKNIEEIVEKSDCIMVARGDLGLQMDIEEVPLAQKLIIRKCRERGKPVITATQMLESMMHSPRPTRAEATDVANAILDGTDAVMLSGETAAGQFPLEAVHYMSRIAVKAETLLHSEHSLTEFHPQRHGKVDHTEAVAHSVAQLAGFLKPKAIVTSTTSGRTAVLVSKFRPPIPIYCAAWNKKVQTQMAMVWGVEAVQIDLPRTTDEQIANAISAFVKQKRLKANDSVIVSAGVPPGIAGNTNMILVETVK
ncbi:MAG TPA: pyruvate kinase [Fimbriimonadaceae bacterium]|jgi:pyruvate kinase